MRRPGRGQGRGQRSLTPPRASYTCDDDEICISQSLFHTFSLNRAGFRLVLGSLPSKLNSLFYMFGFKPRWMTSRVICACPYAAAAPAGGGAPAKTGKGAAGASGGGGRGGTGGSARGRRAAHAGHGKEPMEADSGRGG